MAHSLFKISMDPTVQIYLRVPLMIIHKLEWILHQLLGVEVSSISQAIYQLKANNRKYIINLAK